MRGAQGCSMQNIACAAPNAGRCLRNAERRVPCAKWQRNPLDTECSLVDTHALLNDGCTVHTVEDWALHAA